MVHLTDTNPYRLATHYPTDTIREELSHILIAFKSQLTSYSIFLYKYLNEEPRKPRTPLFYGIPKTLKKYTHTHPLWPIVSQTASILSPTAQPHSPTSCMLIYGLPPCTIHYPPKPSCSRRCSTSVESLYPSIPQTECLNTIYQEMHQHLHLLTFNPNLIKRLLHTNINYNYFAFDNFIFQRIKGTAMGAVFSPTIANIFMSTILCDFLHTQKTLPLLVTRYIDDIFIIWTESIQ